MNHITFKQYRQIDLSILCLVTAIFESIACLASTRWFALQAMTVSITLALTCITMMRWGKFALLPSFVGSLMYCIFTGAKVEQYIIYCIGSLFCIAALPLLNVLKKENARKDFIIRTVFVIVTYVSIALGRWLCSLPFDFSFNSLLAFIGTDILSLLFAIVVMSIAKNVDGLIEDQKSYLIRLEEERIREQEANLNDPF